MKRRTALALPLALGLGLAGCEPTPTAAPGGFTDDAMARGHRMRQADWRAAPPARTLRTQVLIVGAGMAGLAAARALHRRGIEDFLVMDLHDQAGGNARGGQLAGLPHPLGAHYLPLPGEDAPEILEWLQELGLRKRLHGLWVWDERHLCHSPQERVFADGQWHEGLLPPAEPGSATSAQYEAFSLWVGQVQREARFVVPAGRARWSAAQAELDRTTFADALDRHGLTDSKLRWYLDYCCIDDFGAPAATVSAWAGLHYFASRQGFKAPGDATPAEPVLTWPEGNDWLVRQLSANLGDRLRLGLTALALEENRSGVRLLALASDKTETLRIDAQQLVLAVPVHVAARMWPAGPVVLHEAARRIQHSNWVVVNARLRSALEDRGGAAPAWDNVITHGKGLGYVDASHQSLDPRPGPKVLTWYHSLGGSLAARATLRDAPWTHWFTQMQSDLAVPHPDFAERVSHVSVSRHGHAMAIPTPGLQNWLAALQPGRRSAALRQGRVSLAHSDWAGYSILEEAFVRGHWAGSAA